ncbi:MAG: HEPN domain-containing protein [bacterium]
MTKFYKAKIEWLNDWIAQSSDDLRTAGDYIDVDKDYARRNVCYHSQQSIEKILKSYLVANKVDYPDSHNLERLQVMCEELNDGFKEISLLNLKKLTGYATEARYPQFEHERRKITTEDAKEAYNSAVKVKNFVIKRINEISPVTGHEQDIKNNPVPDEKKSIQNKPDINHFEVIKRKFRR